MALAALGLGGGILGSLFGAKNAGDRAANEAGDATIKAAQLGIDEQRAQFEAFQELLAPFVQGGQNAFLNQQSLIGLGGEEAQQAAITQLQQSPQFQSLLEQGESSILQNASATGGLRGGNVQGALAQFSPELLGNTIQQQFQNLGGLSNIGQASAAGVGQAGLQTGTNVSNLIGQQGAAKAGTQLAKGANQANLFGDISGLLANFAGKAGGGF
jgi:hypothetical protein